MAHPSRFYINKSDMHGKEYVTREGDVAIIKEFICNDDVVIIFKDNPDITKHVAFYKLTRGVVKNYYHKSIFGVGYLGEGKYKPYIKRKVVKAYQSWKDMLRRCYAPVADNARYNAYIGCTVHPDWHNYQNFAEWYENHYYEIPGDKITIDKDILSNNSPNKIYSADTCCMVPQIINSNFISCGTKTSGLPNGVRNRSNNKNIYVANLNKDGKAVEIGIFDTPMEAFNAYKIEKEKYIKELADRYKDVLEPLVYDTLYNYEVQPY